jgi:DNA-binding CsgD family transcriptional regulator
VKINRKFWPQEKICECLFKTLTARETFVAVSIWLGLRQKEIAGSMGISQRCVRFHLANILSKTGCQSCVEIALLVERAKRPALPLLPASVFFFAVENWINRKK